MDLKTIILILTVSANFFLVYLSYFKSKKTKVNLAWIIVVLVAICWVVSMIFYRLAGPENSVFWCKILYIVASLIPLALLYFIFLYPEGKWTISRISRILIALLTIFIILLILANKILKDVIIRPGQEKEIIWGGGYIFYALYFSSYFTVALWKLFEKYLKSSSILKIQLRYMLLGIGISATLGCIFNLFLPWFGDFRFNWLGQVTTLFMVAFISYAISRYGLMDIRIVLTELFVVLIALVLLAELILSKSFYEILFRGGIFLAFCFLGYLLMKSVFKEIKAREKLQEMAQKLEKAYEELKRIDLAKSEFISIASHQLRTPLTVIKGYFSLLSDGTYGNFNEKMGKVFKNVYQANERLIGLINDLLDMSRMELGKMQFNFKEISIEDIIDSVVEELKIIAQQKNLLLNWKKAAIPQKKIWGDSDKLRQVILNIIDNAIKYTNRGDITIDLKTLDSKLEVKVSDTGMGIRKDDLETIFKGFERGELVQRINPEGVGLGLNIARKIIEAHKGKIWAESKGEEKGSTFYIELPTI